MRILHLVSYPLYSGPLPQTLGLATAQRAAGHTAWLAHDSKRGNFDGFEEAAEPHVARAGLAAPVVLTLCTKSTPLELWRDVRTLRGFTRAGRADVMHVHTSHDHALLAATLGPGRGRALRVRTIHAARSLEARLGQGWLNRQSDMWLVRGEAHREELCGRFGVPYDDVHVVPGSVDAVRFSPPSLEARAAARARWGFPDGAAVLGHVALFAGRGQEELLTAVKQLAREALHVLFVGSGEHETHVRELAAAMGLSARVRFAGYLEGEALLAAYAAMDAAFLAQPGNDASARAVLEALASGRPVIAVRHDLLGETVSRAVGYPLPSRKPGDIAAGLDEWLADEAEGSRRGAAGRELVVRERSFAREAERTLALYERYLARRA